MHWREGGGCPKLPPRQCMWAPKGASRWLAYYYSDRARPAEHRTPRVQGNTQPSGAPGAMAKFSQPSSSGRKEECDDGPLSARRAALVLVDDDPLITDTLSFVLRAHFEVEIATTREDTKRQLMALPAPVPLALVDLGLPPRPHLPDEGFRLIEELSAMYPRMKILVLSGQSDRSNIQHAMTLGAVDFIPKPCDAALLVSRLQHQLLILESEEQATPGAEAQVSGLVGSSPAMETLREEARRYANTPFPVLVQGESGTGKELVAALLHEQSDRATAPFLTLNCAAVTPELLEAQLFGHARGAFTGAATAREGFFESAGEGTLFLDEIGEFPLELQPKLLRVLENGEFYRVGETQLRVSRARIVAATNRNLVAEIREQRFRHDLYHRLSVLTIDAPPLRSRGQDRIELLEHFKLIYATSVAPFGMDAASRDRWLQYTFPGNVRELRNIVIRLGAKYPGECVGLTQLESELDAQSDLESDALAKLASGEFRLDEILDGWEQRHITVALSLSRGNLSEAARLLGVNRTTLYSKIQRLSLGPAAVPGRAGDVDAGPITKAPELTDSSQHSDWHHGRR